MSGGQDEWEDLVRRLEATDSGAHEPGPIPNGPPPASPGPFSDAAHPVDPTAPIPPDSARAVAGFDFKVDPAAAAGSHGPRDWEAPDEDPFVTDFDPGEPEPILVGRPDRVIAWILGATLPLLMIVLLVVGGSRVPRLLWPVMLAAMLAAWGYLIWRMPHERQDDGDNGARL